MHLDSTQKAFLNLRFLIDLLSKDIFPHRAKQGSKLTNWD